MPDFGLVQVLQDDYAAGVVRGVARHLIPDNGVYDAVNAFLEDDGSITKRAGSEYQSNGAFGASLRWIWDGYLAGGQRTVFASPAAFGVLGGDDATPVSLGGAGLSEPVPAAAIGGMLFIGGGTVYAGSQKAADYSTGTITVTQGSKTVTGAGTAFTANVDAGMLLRVAGAGRYYAVASVDSDTQVTLVDAYEGATAAGQAYALTRLGTAANHGSRTASLYAVVANRLVTLEGDTLFFSNGPNPATGALRPHIFTATDFHRIPGGAQGIAVKAIRDRAIVFTTQGTWVVSNMAFNLFDSVGNPQQRVELLSDSLIAWGAAGVTSWENALIVAATDGVYLVDGVSAPRLLSRSIKTLITGYVNGGYRPGGVAVYAAHLFVPVIDQSAAVIDLLVCKLDRPVKTRLGVVFPWTRFAGHGGNVAALVTRTLAGSARSPKLLGAGRSVDARVVSLTNVFQPATARQSDADATTHEFVVVTRDHATGASNNNLVRRVRVRYEMLIGTSGTPGLQAYYSIGVIQNAGVSLWGSMVWGTGDWTDSMLAEFVLLALSGAPVDDGRRPYAWDFQAHCRFVRYRFSTSDPVSRLTLRSHESFIRQSRSVA